ncbi:helix-turn-helix DNA binding domain protein [Arthrobacter phage Shoya]|uniref:Helix-turn-helix DNA binding domain protein n=1 Tax=Arthrobacter phage Shoya TaxID=2704035 RepID=A0A6G6XI49_9CAUD|nr:helix-turn-helix DNA binding domain protein [Arthrobacter phage Shoya]QIG57737.1 helix-turn-helix DNA binding domain protein [Arthrobacter phage Shoya]
MSNECTTADCANHTSTYLCGQCVSDLQQWLDKVPTLIIELSVTVARLDQVRPANAGWNSGGVPGSAAPINLDALQLQENLRSVGKDAKAYAQDERAAGLAWLIQDWVTKAELLVSGPEEPPINHQANRERIKDIAPPMPTRQLVPWLRQHARVVVTSMDIRNWARRGKIRAVTTEPQPTYHPHEVLDAWHDTRAT